ncbi:uncharacterized protein LOC133888021 isoform X1 [Phragmites australis]|uniref:uncharacterized protein LOC133888021 isoform X1 n=1 Tax=Phragmites australis TaxID=29695 RepID=UPI002D7706A0|nr:uncharacterized protein LOC133888021 isoform X1 [Phragmites australis]
MSTSSGAARPMVATRRSARRSGNGPLPDGEPTGPASSTPPSSGPGLPSSLPRRHSRYTSPPQRSGRTRDMGDSHTVVDISDDNTLKQPVDTEELGRQGKDDVMAEEPDEADEDVEALEEPPGWLPDGWIMEVRRDDNGSIYRYYISPVSGYTFSSKMETLHYLFSGTEDRVLESQACAEDNELHRLHTWLPGGWVIEVRAGGMKMEKMYKFYVHLPTGKRFLSKGEVLRYVNEGKVSRCDMDVLCDTSSDDNILAQVEFSPDNLPDGWVKETIFRKCNDGIRKDPYYTDPVSHHVFRTLKSVLSYLQTGEISKHAYVPRKSVTDMYSFDKCADLPQTMLKRLKVEGRTNHKSMRASVLDRELPSGQTSNHFEGGISAGLTQSDPKGEKFRTVKATSVKEICLETAKRPRGRPKKILKQTNESTSSHCAKSPHKETQHTEVKIEVDISDGEDMPNEKTLEHTEKEKHVVVIQEVDNNLAGKNLSMRKGDNLESVTDPDLHEKENGKLTEAGKKVTCSTVHKFYTRRSSNQTLGSKKG